ncbi:MAG: hypothetical protein MMC33_000788 [Icmadophila ericetorum]|nr:hypothetical protein [Icmadophila ericetorum]
MPTSFTYRIAASYSAKGRRFNPRTDFFSFDPLKQPEPADLTARQRPRSGQDAFFVSNIGRSANVAFGVADGVGGWSDMGIDSAHFSHGLCESMSHIARAMDLKDEDWTNTSSLLWRGYDRVIEDQTIEGGGTTACIAIGSNDGSLEVANLGDSGFVQLRPNAVYYSSNPQTHAFNTPYQLSIIPPKVLARSKIFGGQPLRDYPRDASITNHQVKHGDVLVFATDGVWDNLSPADLLKIVSKYMTDFGAWKIDDNGLSVSKDLKAITDIRGPNRSPDNSIQTLVAVSITAEAKMASINTKRDGPFAKEVKKFFPNEDYHGGKVDDICVVVAVVVEDATQELDS